MTNCLLHEKEVIRYLPVPSLSPSLDAKYRDLLIAINGAFLSFMIVKASDKFSWLNFDGANPTTTESTFAGLKGKSEKS